MAKAPAKKEEKKVEAAAEEEEQAPKKKSRLPLIIGLVVLLAGGGGAWFFMFKDKGADSAPQQAKPQPPKPPVFVPLDAFTVNLSSEQNEQYLQVSATLKVLDQQAADSVKQYMPEVRHKTLVLLSSKRPSEVVSGEGRERLAEEMRQMANNVLLAAAGKPVRPIVLDVPQPAEEPQAADPKPEKEADETAPPGEGAKPQEAAAGNANTTAVPADAAGAPAAGKRATLLSKAAADDPVQSVFFTSFIIQ